MTGVIATIPRMQFFDQTGAPLAGGKLYTYVAGSTTLADTFQDQALTTKNENPILLDATGSCSIWLDPSKSYKLVLKNAKGVMQPGWPTDNVSGAATAVSLTPTLSLYTKLTAIAAGVGSSLMGFIHSGTGAMKRTVLDKLRDRISIRDFGAVGDGVTDDTDAIQAAFDALSPGGEIFIPAGKYMLTEDIRVTKPVTVRGIGPGSYANDLGSYIIQTATDKNAFTLVAATSNYGFSQYGIIAVHFKDMTILGKSNTQRSLAAIGTDTTINGGDFHVRNCSFDNVWIRYFQRTKSLYGIVYLNNWHGGGTSNCDEGIVIARGTASDVGGQNRFFGWTAVAITGTCLHYFEDTLGGSIGLHGCTLSESAFGFRGNQEVKFYSSPCCEFESNSSAGVYFSISGGNPNTSGLKQIEGKFLTNGADVWVDKTTTAFAGGGFTWPMRIDNAYLGSAVGLKVTVPAGHVGIDSPAFIIGRNVTGPNNGKINSSQISANFQGTYESKGPVAVECTFNGSTPSGSVLGSLPIGMKVISVRTCLTANASGSTGLLVGDQGNSSRYTSFNAQSQALNTWVDWPGAAPSLLIDSSNNHLTVTGTAGLLGAAGAIEVRGYMP